MVDLAGSTWPSTPSDQIDDHFADALAPWKFKRSSETTWKALVLTPSITALADGFSFVSSSNDTYEAQAVVSLREFVPTDAPAAIHALIDDLDSALSSRQMAEVVADTAPDAEPYRIHSEAVVEGGDVRVTFVAPSSSLAQSTRRSRLGCRSDIG